MEWIKVTDKLPMRGFVVITYNGDMVEAAWLKTIRENKPHTWSTFSGTKNNITHWMELPQPPSALAKHTIETPTNAPLADVSKSDDSVRDTLIDFIEYLDEQWVMRSCTHEKMVDGYLKLINGC